MQTNILYRPAYSLTTIRLDPNEEVRVEGGSMVSMSSDMALETKAEGGLFKSLARSVLGGESFFVNTYRAGAHGGEVNVAPSLPGDMTALNMAGETLLVQSGSFVACEKTIALDAAWGGAKTFFASEGLIMLRAQGTGQIILSSYGAIHEMVLEPGHRHVVDTGHLVAFSASIGFEVRRVGGLKSTLFSGEGLVVDLTGPGRVLMQTRSTDAFLAWLIPRIPRTSDGRER